jgi:hypothetical protein
VWSYRRWPELVSLDFCVKKVELLKSPLSSAGAWLNFDLAYPSRAIPKDFFPSDEKLYGKPRSRCVLRYPLVKLTCAGLLGYKVCSDIPR